MIDPLTILLPVDVFPPRTGGAGWSTHALAKALLERGHAVTALVPQRGGKGLARRIEDGVPVVDVGYAAPNLPFVANWFRFERFWPQFAEVLVNEVAKAPKARLIIHGQHIQGIGAAVLAAERLGVPAVATVRDHWPHHYFGTGLHGDSVPVERFGWAASATDLLARRGPFGSLSLLALPYIQRHLQRRRAWLRRCDAVVSLSGYITRRLAGIVPPERLHPIPNLVDLAAIEALASQPPRVAIPEHFILFVGKLARNKGAHLLPEVLQAFRQAGGTAPLVIAGGGDPALLAAIRATGTDVHAFDWLAHDDVLRLMRRCAALMFPSTWGEPLSRVLLEACAVGTPIVAMPTGGTPDLLTDGTTALFARSAADLGYKTAQLIANPAQQAALTAATRHLATHHLSSTVVVTQIEQLYDSLVAPTTRQNRVQ